MPGNLRVDEGRSRLGITCQLMWMLLWRCILDLDEGEVWHEWFGGLDEVRRGNVNYYKDS